MGRIRSKNTKPELIVRSMLHRCGFRYSLRRKDLPGKPDIVMPKYKSVVFVHGCYWHRHRACKNATTPAKNQEFWKEKFRRTLERDRQNRLDLKNGGWKVIVVWECEVMRNPEEVLTRILNCIEAGVDLNTYNIPSKKKLLKVAERKLHYSLNQIEKNKRLPTRKKKK